jgi:hypothetical protein
LFAIRGFLVESRLPISVCKVLQARSLRGRTAF